MNGKSCNPEYPSYAFWFNCHFHDLKGPNTTLPNYAIPDAMFCKFFIVLVLARYCWMRIISISTEHLQHRYILQAFVLMRHDSCSVFLEDLLDQIFSLGYSACLNYLIQVAAFKVLCCNLILILDISMLKLKKGSMASD